MSDTKIGIIGAGNIGCFIGAHLIKGGGEVYFLGRARFGTVIQQAGLDIEGNFSVGPEFIHWTTEPSQLPELDVVIFTTKSQDSEAAAREVKGRVKKDALIVSLQNGLKNKETLEKVFRDHRVLSGMVPYNVVQVGETATFRQATKGHVWLERLEDERLKCFQSPAFELSDRIEDIQWGKLLKNLNNALNALSDKPLMHQLRSKAERKLLSLVLKEAIQVLRKSGLKPKNTGLVPVDLAPLVLRFPDPLVSFILKREVHADPSARLSMWQDLQLKRKTEIDYLNGEIVARAKALGIEAPFNARVVELIRNAEAGKLEESRAQYREWVGSL